MQTDDLKDRDRNRDGDGLVRARPVFTCALGWQRSRDDARAPLTLNRPCHFGTLIALGYDLLPPVSILFPCLRCPSSPLFSWEPVPDIIMWRFREAAGFGVRGCALSRNNPYV